jgi:acetyltransferase-like isoleucine patch superfamily enzyme
VIAVLGRAVLKAVANACAVAAVAPAVAASALEERLCPGAEGVFACCAQLLAFLPGLPGVAARRAFYRGTLEVCAADFHIDVGAIFTHRRACVEPGVYIGAYALIGCANLRQGCLVGSRVSLLSGGSPHELQPDGTWSPTDPGRLRQIEIGPHAWIGEGAIVMADIGPKAMVAAGAVVSTAVPSRVMVAGNPARFVRVLEPPAAHMPEREHATGL